MLRNLKTLGIALAAVFALSAVAASGAAAQDGTLVSDGPVTGTGTEIAGETNNLVAFGQTLSCPGAIYTIHKFNETPHKFVSSGASTFTVTPHYEPETKTEKNCKSAAGFFVTFTMNGCDYVLHIGPTAGVGKTYGVTADLVCPAGKVVEVHGYTSTTEAVPVCTYTIGSQEGLSGPHLTDTGAGTVKLTGTFTGLKINRDAGLCGGAAEEAAATITTNLSIAGKNEAGEATSLSLLHL